MSKLVKFLGILLIFSVFGCTGPELLIAPIVNGIIVWSEGEAHKYYAYDPDIMYRATKRALINLNLPVDKDQKLENGNYHVTAGVNNRFQINIYQVDPQISRLSVRINFMGDKPYAELLYQQIDQQINIIQFDEQGQPTITK
jgi:hypothetical protein